MKRSGPPKCSANGTRVFLTATVAPHTFARIDSLASLAEMSRGALIDAAIDCLDVCDDCEGTGVGKDDRRCEGCGGHKVVPTS